MTLLSECLAILQIVHPVSYGPFASSPGRTNVCQNTLVSGSRSNGCYDHIDLSRGQSMILKKTGIPVTGCIICNEKLGGCENWSTIHSFRVLEFLSVDQCLCDAVFGYILSGSANMTKYVYQLQPKILLLLLDHLVNTYVMSMSTYPKWWQILCDSILGRQCYNEYQLSDSNSHWRYILESQSSFIHIPYGKWRWIFLSYIGCQNLFICMLDRKVFALWNCIVFRLIPSGWVLYIF